MGNRHADFGHVAVHDVPAVAGAFEPACQHGLNGLLSVGDVFGGEAVPVAFCLHPLVGIAPVLPVVREKAVCSHVFGVVLGGAGECIIPFQRRGGSVFFVAAGAGFGTGFVDDFQHLLCVGGFRRGGWTRRRGLRNGCGTGGKHGEGG